MMSILKYLKHRVIYIGTCLHIQEKSRPFLPWRVGRKDIDTLLLILVSLFNHGKTTRLVYKIDVVVFENKSTLS